MTDQNKPEFNVVDKRRGNMEGAVEAPDIEQASTEPTDSGSDLNSATTSPDEASESSAESPETDAPYLPDPRMLLSMAAMQLDIRALTKSLLPIFDGYAWRAMGFHADPQTGETRKDLSSAQLAIDCVQFLQSKVESELSESERREMHRRLSDLRMNYLAKMREP